ncbi:Flp/Fap pilin component [Collinsella aerofaciens]|nr:Flp/Fap pilin component [Collinsella aerofaciens]
MDFANSACAHVVVAKNQLKNKLVRDFRAAKAGELSGQGLIEYVLIIAVISLVVVFAGPAVAKAITAQFTKIAGTLTTGNASGFGA